jgi:cell division protein ZipA
MNDIEFMSKADSDARARRVLPLKGSEDARHLLTRPPLPTGTYHDRPSEDITPDPAVDWIVDVELSPGREVAGKQAVDALGVELLGGANVYGYESAKNRWTVAWNSDPPEFFSKLIVGKPLIDTSEEPAPSDQQQLTAFLTAIDASTKELGAIHINPRTTPEEGGRRAERLWELLRECDGDAVLLLQADEDRRFDGRKIWDVMYSLGLKWGNMDLFHWNNPSDFGDGELFSVWTSTDPGYFLPELIAAGKVMTNDLVFSFSVPRSPAPAEVFDEMIKASRYAQSRLGGTILGDEDRPLCKRRSQQAY